MDGLKVLQIANDYLNPLFARMFYAISNQGIENEVVVPIRYNGLVDEAWGNDIIVLKCFSKYDRFFFQYKQKKIVSAIENKVDFTDVDLIHAHTLFSNGYAAYQLSVKYGIPYAVALRNTDVNIFFKLMPHLRKVGIEVMRNASRIIFFSPAYMKHVISWYIPEREQQEILEKSKVIPNGISDSFFDNINENIYYNQSEKIQLLFVGEITRNKNIEKVIEAAHVFQKNGRDVQVTIVGDIVEKRCQALLEDTIVQYHSRCKQEKLIDYFRMADVFVMPSHTETFGLVYAEAMTQGLPVLYTRGQGFDGQFPEGIVGYAIDDTDATDIVRKIELVLKNRDKLSKNCIELCKKFDWNVIAKEYRSVYQAMLRKG